MNNIFGSKSRTLRQQNSWSFFSSTTFAHFVWTFCANWHPINAKIYRIKWDYEFSFSYWVQNEKEYGDIYLFLLFLKTICIPFYQTLFFRIVRWTPLNIIFWLEITNTKTTKLLIIFFINLFSTFCVNFLCKLTSD